jgi:glutamate/tyrosine decarboxylase-like PLP-dependent enzyme
MTAVVHRYAGSDPVGQIAELVTAVLNTNVHTYAVAPAFAMMEQEVIKSMAAQVGMDRATADGILCPGGTFANVTALMVARNEAFPHVRMSGWSPEDRPVCFTSAQVCIPTCIFFCICTDEDVSHRCMAAVAQV